MAPYVCFMYVMVTGAMRTSKSSDGNSRLHSISQCVSTVIQSNRTRGNLFLEAHRKIDNVLTHQHISLIYDNSIKGNINCAHWGEGIFSPLPFFISAKLIELSTRNLQYLSSHQLYTLSANKKFVPTIRWPQRRQSDVMSGGI